MGVGVVANQVSFHLKSSLLVCPRTAFPVLITYGINLAQKGLWKTMKLDTWKEETTSWIRVG